MNPFHYLLNNITKNKSVENEPNKIIKARKVIGFVGDIGNNLDFELLDQLVSQLPMVDFHFIGQIIDFRNAMHLDTFSNVQFYGSQSMTETKKLVQEFDMAVFPLSGKNKSDLHNYEYLKLLNPNIPVVSNHQLDGVLKSSLHCLTLTDSSEVIAEILGIENTVPTSQNKLQFA